MLFKSRKNKDTDVVDAKVDVAVHEPSNKGRKKGFKRSKKLLHSFNETVWETIFAEIDQSYRLRTFDAWFGLALTEDLVASVDNSSGALGEFINLVNRGAIKAIVSEDTVAEDYVVILADEDNIKTVEEYDFIKNSKFPMVKIDEDGIAEITDYHFNFTDIYDAVTGDDVQLTIDDEILSSIDENEDEGMMEEDDVSEFEVNDKPTDHQHVEDEAIENEAFTHGSNNEEQHRDDSTYSLADELSGDLQNKIDELEFEPLLMIEESVDDLMDEVVADELQGDIVAPLLPTEENVRGAVNRVILEGDLDLKVDLDVFDAMFSPIDVVLFDTERMALDGGDGYLELHLNQLSKVANEDLLQANQTNRAWLKDQYTSLMNHVCLEMIEALSFENESGDFGAKLSEFKARRDEAIAMIDDRVIRDKATRMLKWDEDLRQAGEAAKAFAIRQYKERHGKALDAELKALSINYRKNIDISYHKAVEELNVTRKKRAQVYYEKAVSETIKAISDKYKKKLREESKLRDKAKSKIVDFVNENYENEITRVRVLNEELKQRNMAERLREDYEQILAVKVAEMESLVNEISTQQSRFADELETVRRQKDEHYGAKIARMDDRQGRLDDELSDARKDLVKIQKETSDQYTGLITTLENELAGARLQIETERLRQKRQGVGTILVIVVVVPIMFVVGLLASFLLG